MPDDKKPNPVPQPDAGQNSVDAWAAKLGTNPHLLAGAKAHHHWVQGDLLTQGEFEGAIKAFAELEVK